MEPANQARSRRSFIGSIAGLAGSVALCDAGRANAEHLAFAESRTRLQPTVDAYIKRWMKRRQIPGLALAVIHRGNWVVDRGYGVASLELGVPVSRD